MPIYPFQCDAEEACGHIFEKILQLREREEPQPCPKCQGTTHRIYLPNGGNSDACNIDPVVVHRAADGSYRFPGRSDAVVPEGYEKVELRTIRQIEQFERDVNKQHASLIGRRVEIEEQRFNAAQAVRRARLRSAMVHMSALGRMFAAAAMRRGDSHRIRSYDPGFHLEILHQDASNRGVWADVDTGWKERRR